LREEQRVNVVATPFTTPAVGKIRLHPKTTGKLLRRSVITLTASCPS